MFSSSGQLSYGPGIRAAVSVDSGIIDYYRSLIHQYYCVNRQRYAGHITAVRTGKESPTKMDAWGKHQGVIAVNIQVPIDTLPLDAGVITKLNQGRAVVERWKREVGLWCRESRRNEIGQTLLLAKLRW